MWILILILTGVLGGDDDREAVVAKYATFKACDEESARLTEEFKKSYPGDTSFKFDCRLAKNAT